MAVTENRVPICKIARENGGDVPRACLFGCAFGCQDDVEHEPAGVRCNRCGEAGLHWQEVTAPDGRSEKRVLFNERMQRHVCGPSADDFEVVS